MNDLLTLKTVAFVKEKLKDAEAGHDWFHIERVWKLAKRIGHEENVDMLIVELGALLHDIMDAKFHNGDEELGPRIAREFLESEGVTALIIDQVEKIIRHISYKSNIEGNTWMSKELAVVQDADRLDALGAIGIARAFHYGGFKNRVLHNPSIEPATFVSKEAYKSAEGTTINHFYEKLLLLRDKMNTKTGRVLATRRHSFMEEYLTEFSAEWEGIN